MVFLQAQSEAGGGSKQLARLRHRPSRLEQEIQYRVNTLMQSDGKGEVQAFVVLALRPGNDVTVMASKAIKSTGQPLMRTWASEHLRLARERSASIEDHNEEAEDTITRYTFINDPEPGQLDVRQHHPIVRVVPLASLKPKDWNIEAPFRIDNDEDVSKTLLTCLYYLQQQTLKKIAKVWIKGICPRKQAKFPYRNKRGEEVGKMVRIPPWWPSEDISVFREPDHVDRGQRLGLLLHFLRLRPSVEQFKQWNTEKTKQPLKTHRPGGWVAFLKELAPLSIINEISPSEPDKVERRKNVMEKMYAIAQLEEEYKDDAIDGNTLVQPLGADLQKVIERASGFKRSRHPSIASGTADDEKSDSDEDLVQAVAKKARTSTGTRLTARSWKGKASTSARPKHRMPKTDLIEDGGMDFKPDITRTEKHRFTFPPYGANMRRGLSMANTPSQTSFGSTMSDTNSCDPFVFTPASPMSDPGQATSRLAYPSREPMQYQVYDVPQPQFDTVPQTPTFAPNEFLHFEQQHPHLGHDMATLSIGVPATGPQQLAQSPHPALPHLRHGLPSQHPPQQYKQWPEVDLQAFAYEVQHVVPSAQAQHAGFAVGFDDPQNGSGWAPAPFNPHPYVHADNDMGYNNHIYGPNHESPPASLPASVERGYTGHSSGVGDSACPPGYGPFFC